MDILIVGGGLIGASLMLALKNSGVSTLLIESKLTYEKEEDFDARTLALSPSSMRILKCIHLWEELEPDITPINMIHISQKASFGLATLKSEKEPLGYVVEMQHLQKIFHKKLSSEKILNSARLINYDREKKVAVIEKEGEQITVIAQLIVAADGAGSHLREFCKGLNVSEKVYDHVAIVANIGLGRSHNYCAYERFTADGPLALLPMTRMRSALVWSLPYGEAKKVMELSDAEFLKKVHQLFGYRLGKLVKAGKRTLFPLKQSIMTQTISWPFVFIGNAAHTLHPVAGQGFNLGLRDVATLVQCIAGKGLNSQMLEMYQQQRIHDQKAITWLTDNLVELFTNKLPGLHAARGLGLLALENLPLFKKIVGYYTRGFAGITPDLVCGIPIQHKVSYGKL